MDTQQQQNATTSLLTENAIFVQRESGETQKSNLRHQIDDLLFGSVKY
jgi:hypothetical protein